MRSVAPNERLKPPAAWSSLLAPMVPCRDSARWHSPSRPFAKRPSKFGVQASACLPRRTRKRHTPPPSVCGITVNYPELSGTPGTAAFPKTHHSNTPSLQFRLDVKDLPSRTRGTLPPYRRQRLWPNFATCQILRRLQPNWRLPIEARPIHPRSLYGLFVHLFVDPVQWIFTLTGGKSIR
jgi:hypothetical protein